jgi:predicted RNA-binding protein with PUA-like domain
MNYWLMKSEPGEFSFDDLKARPDRTESWSGVRNYQARNFMRAMRAGDLALFYQSSCAQPGVAGVMRIVREAYPDPTSWDPRSEYFDQACSPAKPRWDMVDVAWHGDFRRLVGIDLLRADSALAGMLILRKGNRLSVTPVTEDEFKRVCRLGR